MATRVAQIIGVVALALIACDAPRRDEPAPPDGGPARRRAPKAPRAPSFRVEEGRFTSAALGVDKRYWVAVPADYGKNDLRYPVVYLLHGFGGSPQNWVQNAPLAAGAADLRALIVMVDGDDSFYVDWHRPADYERCVREDRRWGAVDEADYCVRTGGYEEYVVNDVVARIDATYRTIADRTGRALLGFSMGGYGALMLGMRHPDVYSVAVSHAGVDSLLYGGPRPYERGRARRLDDLAAWGREYESEIEGVGDHVRGLLGPDIANWRAHDPVALAETLHDGQLALYLDCGTEDEFHFDDLAQDLHDTLERRGIHHAFALVPGGHDGGFLQDRLDDGMRFIAAHVAAPRAR